MQETLKQAMASAMQNNIHGDEELADWTVAQIQPWMDTQGVKRCVTENNSGSMGYDRASI